MEGIALSAVAIESAGVEASLSDREQAIREQQCSENGGHWKAGFNGTRKERANADEVRTEKMHFALWITLPCEEYSGITLLEVERSETVRYIYGTA